jgi:hypothetical protein
MRIIRIVAFVAGFELTAILAGLVIARVALWLDRRAAG